MKDVQNVIIAIEWLAIFSFGLLSGLWAVVPLFVLGAGLWSAYNFVDPVALGPIGEAAMNAIRILMWGDACAILLRLMDRRALLWLGSWVAFTALGTAAIITSGGDGYRAARNAMVCVPLIVMLALGLQDALIRRFPCGRIARRHFWLMTYSCGLVTAIAVTRPLYRDYDTWLTLRWWYIAGTFAIVAGYWKLGHDIRESGLKNRMILTHTL